MLYRGAHAGLTWPGLTPRTLNTRPKKLKLYSLNTNPKPKAPLCLTVRRIHSEWGSTRNL